MKRLLTLLMVASLVALAGCGGGSQHSTDALAGNWQFTVTPPSDNSFAGGIQGGFLQQNGNAVTGAVVYSVWVPPLTSVSPCNSGTAPVTGTIDGSSVTLTAAAGGQTFTLTGALSRDGSTMAGTYTSTAGTAANGAVCGTAQSGLPWSALVVPPLSGAVQGNFHSIGALQNQDFPVTGFLSQGENIGASNAAVTGTLIFQGYSCLGSSAHQTVTVNGTISGSSVVLQVFADSGVNIGQIGQSLALNSQVLPVVFESIASGGYVLHNPPVANYGGYNVGTKACPADSGNVCLAMGDGTACTQPISLSPASVAFPAQLVGSTSTTQTITLTNTDPAGGTLSGLSLSWQYSPSNFDGWPGFLELDSCASPAGSTFTLQPNQSCTVTVFFSPQESCPWQPVAASSGVAPANCPPFTSYTQSAKLVVNSPRSVDYDTEFAVPIGGVGLSALVPSTPELDFGAEALTESSAPQPLTFTNQGMFSVRILPAASVANACSAQAVTLPRPVQSGDVDGLRVVQGGAGSSNTISVFPTSTGRETVEYYCDYDPSNSSIADPGLHANFQISADSCTGSLLYPGDSCAATFTYVPQPATLATNGLDYFLELNTQECPGNSLQPDCEIDSGRFPVELKANPASPLRMSPAAGLDFGTQAQGTSSAALTVTLFNDPQDPQSGSVSFQGNTFAGSSAYTETDNCGATLAPGSSCTMSFVFTPTSTGFQQGTMAINYIVPGRPALSSLVAPQIVYLRGAGH